MMRSECSNCFVMYETLPSNGPCKLHSSNGLRVCLSVNFFLPEILVCSVTFAVYRLLPLLYHLQTPEIIHEIHACITEVLSDVI